MKIEKALIFVLVFTGISACTPAKLVGLPETTSENRSEVLIYRENVLNSSAVTSVFGANSLDYIEIENTSYAKIYLPSGDYEFYVRSNQADKPYKHRAHISPEKILCLKITPNPTNPAKALMPIAYWMSNAFLLDETECPSADKLSQLTDANAQS